VAYADPKNGKYPIDTKAHAAAAWSYISKPENAAKYPLNGVTLSAVKARIRAACRKFGITISEGNSAPMDGEIRTVPLAAPMDVSSNGDGLTFEGYAAVYNRTARIQASDGDFDEQIMPGAFRAVADGAYPVLMFEHGRHPLIGTMPLGRITGAREDDTGLWIEARLTDNWLIQPVRDAVANGALDGMSFRFTVDDGGETWMDRNGEVPLRSLTSLSVPELGPVVFPAYEPTTASVRSVLDKLPVIGRPPAGARAASGREEGEAPERAEPDPTLSDRFRRDGEALALRGIRGVRIA
jgi:HK97 family phage prohead protease